MNHIGHRMEDVVIPGLSIVMERTIDAIRISNARSVERKEAGIQWNGRVTLLHGGGAVQNKVVQTAIRDNTFTTFEELNIEANSEFSNDYNDLTVIQAQNIHGSVMARKIISAIDSGDSGISIEDITALVTSIVSAL